MGARLLGAIGRSQGLRRRSVAQSRGGSRQLGCLHQGYPQQFRLSAQVAFPLLLGGLAAIG
jgi:hypothetical protein